MRFWQCGNLVTPWLKSALCVNPFNAKPTLLILVIAGGYQRRSHHFRRAAFHMAESSSSTRSSLSWHGLLANSDKKRDRAVAQPAGERSEETIHTRCHCRVGNQTRESSGHDGLFVYTGLSHYRGHSAVTKHIRATGPGCAFRDSSYQWELSRQRYVCILAL